MSYWESNIFLTVHLFIKIVVSKLFIEPPIKKKAYIIIINIPNDIL
jgi:hypothetical protein